MGVTQEDNNRLKQRALEYIPRESSETLEVEQQVMCPSRTKETTTASTSELDVQMKTQYQHVDVVRGGSGTYYNYYGWEDAQTWTNTCMVYRTIG